MDHYSVLGVSSGASIDEIKKAWRKIARTTHPDTASSAGAEHLYLAAQEAYEVLSDDAKRASYDFSLKKDQGGSAAPAPAPEPEPEPSPPPAYVPPQPAASYYGYAQEPVSAAPVREEPPVPVHRARWRVGAALVMSIVAVLASFSYVAPGATVWGHTFLVVGVAIVSLVILSGEGVNSWKFWVWGLMALLAMKTYGVGVPILVFFGVPSFGAWLSAWRVGKAPRKKRGSPQSWTVKGSGRKNSAGVRAAV